MNDLKAKIDDLFFENTSGKLKKVIMIVTRVLIVIITIAALLSMLGILTYRWRSFGVKLITILGIAVAYVFIMFMLWLSNTTILMFCDLVNNTGRLVELKENEKKTEE